MEDGLRLEDLMTRVEIECGHFRSLQEYVDIAMEGNILMSTDVRLVDGMRLFMVVNTPAKKFLWHPMTIPHYTYARRIIVQGSTASSCHAWGPDECALGMSSHEMHHGVHSMVAQVAFGEHEEWSLVHNDTASLGVAYFTDAVETNMVDVCDSIAKICTITRTPRRQNQNKKVVLSVDIDAHTMKFKMGTDSQENWPWSADIELPMRPCDQPQCPLRWTLSMEGETMVTVLSFD
jgi:hypothetical protein